jgi:hypothetical protein
MRSINAEGECNRMRSAGRNQYADPIGPEITPGISSASEIRARRIAARSAVMGESSPASQPRSGDMITGRIFGQHITLQRCEWVAFASDPETHARAAEIATRPADSPDDAR